MRDRYRCFPVPKCLCIRILAGALSPEKKISGGKGLFTESRRVRSRVATALRMCAQSLHHAKNCLGEFSRRITRKLGRPQAITATAHKLARIIFHLLNTKEAYNESIFHKTEEDTIRRAQYRLRGHLPNLVFRSSRGQQVMFHGSRHGDRNLLTCVG